MDRITEQYEAYPYPARDPADEARRLVTGSPSHPLEMDHALWGGRRDWSRPLRVLVAGGGTGDALVQIAQVMASAGRPADITYIDLSQRAQDIARARIAARGLSGVAFHRASLLDAPDFGSFDYIDCCGVLHHLPDPAEGFAALRGALAEDGGMGMMVYAPYGRSGVYPLQEAFGTLFATLAPEERLAHAREVVARLPEGHPFRSNPNLVDHRASDAGFYDLLLHSQDRAYDVETLLALVESTGWQLSAFAQPGLYDPAQFTAHADALPEVARMALAERLNGTIKTHVAYLRAAGAPLHRPRPDDLSRVPHLRGATPEALARAVAAGRPVPVRAGGVSREVVLPKGAARLVAGIDGRRTLAEIAAGAGVDPLAFGTLWRPVEAALVPWGLLLYSGLLRRS
ncbi:class I SAM-dependent methyltransferase [Roseivivax isoporae]|uniref:Methyltransferase n=1 Tax=Roseivivax isoporae LMG 25204 TaxID=1449351 RepID=X7FBL9_9RHOB|nr:class I SAM-dependent methyltransferase [Roseivivax isoporae]ETX30190.1 methyltransferase [Roseivivax isoporae LMG 25204]